jgi:hypothetical protein
MGVTPVAYDELLEIVENTFLEPCNSRSQWVREIMKEVSANHSFLVRVCDLIRATAAVNMKYLEYEAVTPSSLPGADHGRLVGAITEARRKAIEWLKSDFLWDKVVNEKISRDYADRFALAAERYLCDLAHSPGTDKFPVYFREVMPDYEHGKYKTNFRHLFETTMKRAEEKFKFLLQQLL